MIVTDVSNFKKFSHKLILVSCDLQESEKCYKQWQCKLSEISVKRKRTNTELDYCLPCSILKNFSGNKSHFFKYQKDDFYFSDISSEDKAYFLGWLASDGHVRRKRFTIKIQDRDSSILELFSKYIKSEIPIHHKIYDEKKWAILDVSSMKMTADLIKLLNINYGAKDYTVCFPILNEELTWAFIRGLFEGDGHVPKINNKSKRCRIFIASVSKDMKNGLINFLSIFNIKSYSSKKGVSINGRYAVKFIDNIYKRNIGSNLYLRRKRDACLLWEHYAPKTKKLSLDEANEIRKLKQSGISVINIAKFFNVNSTTIYSIITNISYKELK